MQQLPVTMKDAACLLNAISESAATDSRGLELIIDKILQVVTP